LYSTTEDLQRWEQALFAGTVISPASLKKMTTPFKNDYAFGLAVHKVHDRDVIEHGGGIEGFNTQLSYFPADKLIVIVLGNLNSSAPEELAGQLASIVHGEKVVLPAERKEITVPKEVLRRYVGTYPLTPEFSITISLEGNQLMTQATKQPKFPLFAESETLFFLKVVDAQVEFSKDEKGEFNILTLHQGGRDSKATKK
jgi:CubicO group peptidase (beta-lactamase class C family)